MADLSSLLQTIQIVLLVGSSALIIGVLYGMHSRSQDIHLNVLARTAGDNSENRRERRVKCNLFIEIMDHRDQVAGIGRLLNLSSAGACISSKADLRRGEPILARLPTLRNGVNRISGHVIWARAAADQTYYGIQLNRSTPVHTS